MNSIHIILCSGIILKHHQPLKHLQVNINGNVIKMNFTSMIVSITFRYIIRKLTLHLTKVTLEFKFILILLK